jgi:O-antigen ligase
MDRPPSSAWQADHDDSDTESGYGFAGFGFLCFCAWLCASAEPASLTGAAFVFAGMLILLMPVPSRISGVCWIAAAMWLLGSLSAFLPAALVVQPGWRGLLESAGIDTGWRITPQPLAALGSLATMTATGLVALWAANQQTGRRSFLGMAFVLAVGVFAVVSWQGPGLLHHQSNSQGTFGFFPNRNHTATLLVMGIVAGLGLLTHGVRRRRWWLIGACSLIPAFLLWVLFSLSISRAGIVLVCAGGLVWLILAGKRNLSGNPGKAIALLMGGGTLIFLLLDTPVKRRLDLMVGQLRHGSSLQASDSLDRSDGRMEIFHDTAAMIADSPWTGWGQGQFQFLFPQYQKQTADLSGNVCLHPESDWLWMAAESGVPATLALATLALGVIIPVVRSIRRGRASAMRAGFLTAALILPLHGLFDVPGHGFSLLWTSALLVALAAGQRKNPQFPRTSAVGWRLAGIGVAGFGIALLSAEWTGRPLLAADRSDRLFQETIELYRQEHRSGAVPEAEDADLLLGGLTKLSEASALTPLDQRLRGLGGMLALHYDERDDEAHRAFAWQRLLEPNWVELPLIQADGWIKIDEAETGKLWKIAMERARILDQRISTEHWQQKVFKKIQERAGKSPGLLNLAREAAAGDSSRFEGID